MKVLFFSNSRFLTDKFTIGKCRNCNMLLENSLYREHFVYACMIKLKKDETGTPQLIYSFEKLKNRPQRKRTCIECFMRISKKFAKPTIEKFIKMPSEQLVFHTKPSQIMVNQARN